MNDIELKRYCERLEKALAQVVYDCDDYDTDWGVIAESHGNYDLLKESIAKHGYVNGVVDYYKRMTYVFEGSLK